MTLFSDPRASLAYGKSTTRRGLVRKRRSFRSQAGIPYGWRIHTELRTPGEPRRRELNSVLREAPDSRPVLCEGRLDQPTDVMILGHNPGLESPPLDGRFWDGESCNWRFQPSRTRWPACREEPASDSRGSRLPEIHGRAAEKDRCHPGASF